MIKQKLFYFYEKNVPDQMDEIQKLFDDGYLIKQMCAITTETTLGSVLILFEKEI